MAVTANQLKKTGARGAEFDSIVRSQISLIDDTLHRAERHWGRNVVAHELPGNIVINGLKGRDAQRIVYSSLIKSYKDRGFEVRLLLEPGRPYMLYLAWVTDLDQAELDAINAVIKNARITLEDLDSFLANQGAGSLGSHDEGAGGANNASRARGASSASVAGAADSASTANYAGGASGAGNAPRYRKRAQGGKYPGAFDPGEAEVEEGARGGPIDTSVNYAT